MTGLTPWYTPCFNEELCVDTHPISLATVALQGQALNDRPEDDEAIGGPQRRFHRALWMRHEADNVAFTIADSSDGVESSVRVCREIVDAGRASVRMNVAENHLLVPFQIRQSRHIAKIISFHVRDGHLEHLALLGRARERSVRALHADVNLAAEKAQLLVAHHRARKKARLEKNLKSVADAEHESARARETLDGPHHRREARDRAGAKIIPKREPAGKNDCVEPRNLLRLVPDKFYGLADDRTDRVVRVIVAIRSRKLHDAKLHFASPEKLILAQRLRSPTG